MNIWFTGLIFETQILLVKVFPKNLHKKRLPTQNSNLLVVLQIFSFRLLQNPKENWSIFEVDLKSSCRGMRDHTVCHLPNCFKLQNENVSPKNVAKNISWKFQRKKKTWEKQRISRNEVVIVSIGRHYDKKLQKSKLESFWTCSNEDMN